MVPGTVGAVTARTRTIDVAGVRTHLTEAGAGDSPVVCVHGNPDSAAVWTPLLARADELGRVIAPDLPGFGHSERPDAARFDMTVDAYDRWFDTLIDELHLERFRLVVHDWGSIALSAASRRPERVERLVVIDAVPLNDAYRWHWVGRVWRTPKLGEAMMAAFNRTTLRALTRLPSPHWRPMPDGWIDSVVATLDAGTKDAILRLYRSAGPEPLARHGQHLGALTCPTLVLWGEGDPYIGVDDGRLVAQCFAHAEFETVPGVGHWCMVEQPGVFDRVAAFLTAAD